MSEIMNKKITDGNYDQSLAVKCINGTFIGKKTDNIISYKGIPFVEKQPVGEQRWKAPVEYAPNDGVYEAYHFAKLSVQTEIKYEGYVRRQIDDAKRSERLEEKAIPDNIDYDSIGGLRIEARQKLSKIRPSSIGQASRISGVSPADISVLIIYLTVKKHGKEE